MTGRANRRRSPYDPTLNLQHAWDVIHEALTFPRCGVRQLPAGYDVIGSTLNSVSHGPVVLKWQRSVTWQLTRDRDFYLLTLACTLMEEEPIEFGWLPLPVGDGIQLSINLWAPESPLQIRAIRSAMGPHPPEGMEPYLMSNRLDVLYAK